MIVEQWIKIDETNGLIFPYYSHTFLDILNAWDIKNWKVFEYGGGDSTTWWRNKTNECVSVDTNPAWSQKCDLILESTKDKFIEYPLGIVEQTGELFDCIVIDGEPVIWRDECTETALKCLKKGGILIIDNWLQDTIEGLGNNDWLRSKVLLKDYEGTAYKQPNHKDWKTAYWIIK
jgi:hypothetical protein